MTATEHLTPYMEVETCDTYFRWHGGEYVEVGHIEMVDFHAYDVINVWDYEKSEPRIPRTLDGFATAVAEYIKERADEVEDA